MVEFTAHFSRGRLPIAFVFSVPGEEECRAGKPVAGETGVNLELALQRLNAARPQLFSSLQRYDYRITNTATEPIAVSLGNSSSEPTNAEVIAPFNLERILKEVDGCSLIILCGRKPKLISSAIAIAGRTVLCTWHVGNKALNGKYKLPNTFKSATPFARREERSRLWAEDLLQLIEPLNAA